MDQFRVKDTKYNTMHLVFGLKDFSHKVEWLFISLYFGN